MHPSKDFLLQALHEAQQGLGFCAPNPAVGAVVVRNGVIVACGYHRGVGLAHAEVEVLKKLDSEARGCDLYVTLEPCCHHGRTPPCTDLIIQSGIAHVYFGFYDPNPNVAGKGQQILSDAGIPCDHVRLTEIDNFYQPYHYWWQHKRPWVTLKLAITDQHQIAIDTLTGKPCQKYTHQQRLQHDALLTTVKTIIHDNPQFNARLIDASIKKPLYILDRKADLPLTATVLKTCDPITIFYNDASQEKLVALQQANVNCIKIPIANAQLDLNACLEHIGKTGMHTLWVESGWTNASSFIKQGLVHELLYYVAKANNKAKTRDFDFVYEPIGERNIEFMYLGDDLCVCFSCIL